MKKSLVLHNRLPSFRWASPCHCFSTTSQVLKKWWRAPQIVSRPITTIIGSHGVAIVTSCNAVRGQLQGHCAGTDLSFVRVADDPLSGAE